MRFKSRKAAVPALLIILAVTQVVFAGIKSSDSRKADTLPVVNSTETATEYMVAQGSAEDESTGPITEEEVVSADLNVVYRSTLTSTEVVDEFESNIDKGDFYNKIVSYTCERLCVYSEADLKSDVVGVMYSGSQADILENGEEWTKIKSGEVTGYVRNVDVLFANEAEIIATMLGNKEAVVDAEETSVYADASDQSDVISTLYKGAVIDAYDECDGFILVTCDNGYGYIKSDKVTVSYGLSSAITIEEEQRKQAEEAAAAAKKAAEEAAAAAAIAAAQKYQEVTSTSRSAYNASADEIHLMAAIIYWEAGWEPMEGKLAVANVVLNRVLSSRFSQNTIAGVIYAPGQFSGVASGGVPTERFSNVLNMSNEQLNERGCYDAALAALSGQNNIGDMLFFINVKKANFTKYTSYTIINNHCFYIY